LIFESGTRKQLDIVYTVTAPEAIRMERAAKRDGVSRERIQERMSAQWSDARRLEHSDGAIINDGAQMLIPQILALHMKFSVKSE
jgi:dephospho-CoA kinase